MNPLRRAILAIFLTVGVLPSAAHAQTVPASGVPVTVVRVVDGDTLDVQLPAGTRERLRLIGLDTPEVVDPRKPVQCFGREASARAKELLPAGTVVTLETDPTQGERDRYGRLLAYVSLPDGRNFAGVLIAEGYAHEYTYRLPYAHQAAFREAQRQARESGLGLWSPDTCAGLAATADLADDAPPPLAAYTGQFDPFGPDVDCGQFRTWEEAQAFYVAAGGPESDRHRLDSDDDGIACETLRGAVKEWARRG
jgi:micrococcal nuclease